MKKSNEPLINKVLAEFYTGEKSVGEICSEYGISRSTIYLWKKKYGLHKSKESEVSFTYNDLTKLKGEIDKLEKDLNIYRDVIGLLDLLLKDKLSLLEALHGKYPVKTMCRVLGVDHSTFYNYHYRRVTKTQYQIWDEKLKKEIKNIYFESDKRFGVKKITAKLRENQIKTSEKKVAALMRELNLKSRQARKKSFVPKPSKRPAFPNHLHREFNQIKPNTFWVGDITQIKIGYVSTYLCIILDLFSRKVIAYRLSSQSNEKLVVNTFKDAFESRNRPESLSFHSDRGAVYLSNAYRDLLRFYNVRQSCSKSANPYDNAVVEAFFSNFKREEINSGTFSDFKELNEAID